MSQVQTQPFSSYRSRGGKGMLWQIPTTSTSVLLAHYRFCSLFLNKLNQRRVAKGDELDVLLRCGGEGLVQKKKKKIVRVLFNRLTVPSCWQIDIHPSKSNHQPTNHSCNRQLILVRAVEQVPMPNQPTSQSLPFANASWRSLKIGTIYINLMSIQLAVAAGCGARFALRCFCLGRSCLWGFQGKFIHSDEVMEFSYA